MNVPAHLSVCIFVPHSAVQYLKIFQKLREKKPDLCISSLIFITGMKQRSKLLSLVFIGLVS